MNIVRMGKVIKNAAASLLAFAIIIPAAGCELPAISLYEPENPADSLSETIDAINRCDEKRINELLYNCIWSDDTDVELSESDQMLADALAQSRSIVINQQSISEDNDRQAELSVSLTVLDMSAFEEALTKAVEADVKQQMYEGMEITDTNAIIDQNKQKLLEHPGQFYKTSDYSVQMILSKGQWHLVMTDDFYDALLGQN